MISVEGAEGSENQSSDAHTFLAMNPSAAFFLWDSPPLVFMRIFITCCHVGRKRPHNLYLFVGLTGGGVVTCCSPVGSQPVRETHNLLFSGGGGGGGQRARPGDARHPRARGAARPSQLPGEARGG